MKIDDGLQKLRTSLPERSRAWKSSYKPDLLLTEEQDLLNGRSILADPTLHKLTDDEIDYLVSSREAAQNRAITSAKAQWQRWRIGFLAASALAVTLIVILIVVLVFNNRDNSQQEQISMATAQNQVVTQNSAFNATATLHIATVESAESHVTSLTMAAAAQELAKQRDTAALALAVEANSLSHPHPNAERILAEVVQDMPLRHLTGFNAIVEQVIYNPANPNQFAAATRQKAVIIWDMQQEASVTDYRTTTADVITVIAYSSSGHWLAGGDEAGNVWVWDTQSGTLLEGMPIMNQAPTGRVTSLAFHPDEVQLLIGYGSGGLTLWDLSRMQNVEGYPLQMAHIAWVNALIFIGDGSSFLSAGQGDWLMKQWDTATALELQQYAGHTNAVTAIDVTNDGQVALSASTDGSLILWDVLTGNQLPIDFVDEALEGDNKGVTAARFNASEDLIITGHAGNGSDNPILVWNRYNGEQTLRHLNFHNDDVTSLDIHPTEQQFISSSRDQSVMIWDTLVGGQSALVVSDRTLTAAALDPLGASVATGDSTGGVSIWASYSAERLHTDQSHDSAVTHLLYTPGREVLSIDANGIIVMRLLEGYGIVASQDALVGQQIVSVILLDNAMTLVTGDKDGDMTWLAYPDLAVSRTNTLSSDEHFIAMAIAPDGQMSYTVSNRSREIKQWDLTTQPAVGQVFPAQEHHEHRITQLAISPDGQLLASADSEGHVRLWNAADGSFLGHFRGLRNTVTALMFSLDGQMIAASSSDGTTLIWDLFGQTLRHLPGQALDPLHINFREDNRQVMIANQEMVALWRLDPREELLYWIFETRFVPELDCQMRRNFQADVQCFDQPDSTNPYPTRTPYQIPLPTPTP